MANSPALYGTGETSDDKARTATADRKKETEGKKPPDALVKVYRREIERYERATRSWYEEGAQIENVYLKDQDTAASSRKYSLLYSNVETLKPAVYAKIPTVTCSRRYKDRDPVARTAAELMERASNTTLDLYGADETFKLVRDDRLLPGRGQGWVRYEAELEEYEEQTEEKDDQGEYVMATRERLSSEKVCADYVHWKDFGHNVARTWQEVWLVWRCVYKTHADVAKRWDTKTANRLKYTATPPAGGGEGKTEDEEEKYCKIYELWDKTRRKVAWLADNDPDFLEIGKPPINFRKGFPCPEPCYGAKTSKQLIPRPDYVYYRDQAKEINDLTEKIHRLTQWLIVKGFVPAGPSSVADPIEEALRDKNNAELFVQVDSMKEWSERGGAAKLIDWLPIEAVVEAIKAAIEARRVLVQDVYELTGIGQALRGETDARKTRGAVEIEAQTGSRRLKNTKDDLARWCRDMAALTAEVIAEKFEPQSIADITGYKYVPIQQTAMPGQPGMMGNVVQFPGMQQPGMQQPGQEMMGGDDQGQDGLVFDDRHIQLLRDDRMRSFRIDVETDQTGQGDENMEKERRIELLTGMGASMKQMVEVGAASPDMAAVMKDLVIFTLRSFRVGRTIEESIERNFDKAVAQARQAQAAAAQKPDPEMLKAQTQVQVAQAELQMDAQRGQQEMQIEGQKAQQQMQIAQQTAQQDAQIKQQTAMLDAQTKSRVAMITAASQARDRAQRILGGSERPSRMQ